MSKKCVKCGAELADADLFCGECGTKQPQTATHCSNCGEEIPSSSKFCPNCGTPVSSISVPMAVKPSSAYPDCLITEPDTDTISINVKGVKFNMKLVEGGMLDEYTELSDFYIGETVVTQELWQMVMGENPSEDNSDLQLPVTNINAAMSNAFMRQLEKLTGADFCIPTVYQWQFAHNGGKKSTRKTKYAGSDNADEVAWVKSNSGKALHPVGMLNPNDLGLFDMDGNVQEYCMGKFTKTNKYQFNPTYSSDIISVGTSAKSDKDSSPDFIGLRLAINVPIFESIVSEKIKDGESHNVSSTALSAESLLYDILNHQQQQMEKRFSAEIEAEKQRKEAEAEEKKRREAEALARKHLTHTLTIIAVKDQLAGMMATRVALGWTPSESREKFSLLPVEIMVSDDTSSATKVYKQLADAGIEVDVCTINGLGEHVDARLVDQRLLASCKKGNVFTGFQSKHKKSITEYTVPDNYTSIAESAFRGCINLVTIDLPDSIQSIGEYAFAGCKNLKSIHIPSSVTLIPRKCFEGCEMLENVEMHDSIIEIKSFAFHNCKKLKKLDLPSALKRIGATSLDKSGVEKMKIPKSVEIGDRIMECLEGL